MTDEEVTEIIKKTVSEMVDRPSVNYYKATESLLHNYKKLESICNNAEEYTEVYAQECSKSIVAFSHNSGYIEHPLTEEERLDEVRAERIGSFKETCEGFAILRQVVGLFRQDDDFAVIEKYYMGDHPRNWLDVAIELGMDEKTARRKKTRIIKNMSICLFGIPAAVANARNAPETRP